MAVGTAIAADELTLTYSDNGVIQTLTDGEVNKTTFEYDGHDRLFKTRFPVTTKGGNASSTTDYEQLTYDAASNVTNRRLRDATNIAFTYDRLERPTLKDPPGSEPDVTFAYDLLDRLTSASQTGNSLSFAYDALSRNLTQVSPQGTLSATYDLSGRRTRLTYPGTGLFVDYDYHTTGELWKIRENGATSGVGVLATYTYDGLGRLASLTRGNGAVTSFAYDVGGAITTLAENFTGTANDVSTGFTYNPARQIASSTRNNDAYAWTGHGNGSTTSVTNGLNQLTSVGGAAVTHDARGNLTSDPTSGKTYAYSSENLLTSASGGVTLAYDPLTRLRQVTGAATTRFGYDGVEAIAEYDGSNAVLKRYVFGPGVDEPLVEYTGSGTGTRTFLHADERGSIIARSDGTGAVAQINKYDEFGKPQTTNVGRFQYTGQAWVPELGAYHYKARVYLPGLGRFLQTDPIGYEAEPNLYAYVVNDPVNLVDPLGLQICSGDRVYVRNERQPATDDDGTIVITGGFCILRSWLEKMLPPRTGRARPTNTARPRPIRSREQQCAGYADLKMVQDVTGAASSITGAISDALKLSPAMVSPHGRALQRSMQRASTLTGLTSAGTGLAMGVKYGDWRSATTGVSGFVSGSAASALYGRYARAMGMKNTDLSQAIVENFAEAAGGNLDFGSSGQCGSTP